MSKDRVYNMALDMFMEKKVQYMSMIKSFPKELYYNARDKHYLLYELEPSVAKQIWETLQDNIYFNKDAQWLSGLVCPFCIDAAMQAQNSSDSCQHCRYRLNHRGLSCKNLESDVAMITKEAVYTIDNSEYVDIIASISKELFKSVKANHNETEVNSFKIIREKLNKPNSQDTFLTDSLYEEYNFVLMKTNNRLVSDKDIERVKNADFTYVASKNIKRIFNLAEHLNSIESDFNFIVYASGEIKLGHHMKYIKEHLNELKQSYDEFLKRVDGYNVIRVKFTE